MVPEYEVAGEGQSTLDYGFNSAGQNWLVELMRLEETRAVRNATRVDFDPERISWASTELRH